MELFEKRYPAEQALSGRAWLARVNARGSIEEKECWDLGPHVGVPGAPGALCLGSVPRVLAKRGTVYRLEEGKPRAVWKAVVAAGSGWVSLTPVLTADGQRLELREPRPRNCEMALCAYEQKREYGIDDGFGSALGEACAELGRYEFRDGKFVLVEHTGPGRDRAMPIETGGTGCTE